MYFWTKEIEIKKLCILWACFGKHCTSMQFSSDGIAENCVLFTEFKILRCEYQHVVHGKFRSHLLEDTGVQRIRPATALLEKVSVVHNYNAQCYFTDAEQSVVEERECADKNTFSNMISPTTYILNRFYLGNHGSTLQMELHM